MYALFARIGHRITCEITLGASRGNGTWLCCGRRLHGVDSQQPV